MNLKCSILMFLFILFVTSVFSQVKSRKQIREERTIEKKKNTEAMIDAREFVFVGQIAMPTGYKSINLTTNPNYVNFHPDLIESYMPFYGRAYSGVGYGGDNGLKFKGKPEDYKVVKGPKNFQIDVTIKGTNDIYKLSLIVSFEGSASLSIVSNNRSFISYNGEITAPEKPGEKNGNP